ncbi:MAG: PIN domain-containing protein [Candidatus Hydrogenedentota bacterium]
MRGQVLLDAGPLVALLDRRDRYHDWAKEQADRVRWPISTCEPVVAEAFYLLRELPPAREAIMELLARGALTVPFHLETHVTAIASLLERYADVPMSLADACLVHMSEMVPGSTLYTMDSDFRVYRRHRREPIPLLIPTDR